ncbi:MAG: hypothetical protein EKK31_31900 [Hyphomicrobiales bacterium]|nr:MAG: hypothetical protein EKK31_31900 [Hyphomicrobiales bacterium]
MSHTLATGLIMRQRGILKTACAVLFLPSLGIGSVPAHADDYVILSDGERISGFQDITSTVMANCPDKRYNDTKLGTLYAVLSAYKSYFDIRFETGAAGDWPGRSELLHDLDLCLQGKTPDAAGAGSSSGAAPSPTNQSSPADQDSSASDEVSEQEKSRRMSSIADASTDSVLSGFDDTGTSDTGKDHKVRKGHPKEETPKGYKAALGCIRVLNSGPGFFSNVLGNSCAYKVSVSFCTVSPRGTGAFNCKRNQFGVDVIAPGGRQAIMGAGVPDRDDPFQVLFTACEYPGGPVVTNVHAKSMEFVCR